MYQPQNFQGQLLGTTSFKRKSNRGMSTINSRKSGVLRKSIRSIASESRGNQSRPEPVMTITNNVTLPKNLYQTKEITKDNKSRWETASRKLRVLVPVLVQLNNVKTRK